MAFVFAILLPALAKVLGHNAKKPHQLAAADILISQLLWEAITML
jgi:hypothetical protein